MNTSPRLADAMMQAPEETIVSDEQLALPRPKQLLLALVRGQQLGVARYRRTPTRLEANERCRLLASKFQDALGVSSSRAVRSLLSAVLAAWEERGESLALSLEHPREPALLQAYVHDFGMFEQSRNPNSVVVVLREAVWRTTRLDGWPARLSMSRRQQEVTDLLTGTGMSFAEISDALDIRLGTMRKHAENIYRIAGVRSRAELVAAARASSIRHPG